jgi:DUF3011 family protein
MRALSFTVPALALLLAGCAGFPQAGYPSSGYGYPQTGYPQAGYPQTGYPQAGNGGGGSLRCESDNGATRHCDADVRGGVRLARQLSRTDCVEGRNWGYDSRGIWVSGGCRGEFTLGAAYGSSAYGGNAYGGVVSGGQTLRCESVDGREQHCAIGVNGGVELQRQLSRTPCVQGRNWRWDRGGIWVKDGCRGEFRTF